MRALVTWLRETQGRRVVFRDVPPGSWRSEFFGVSERLIVKPIKDAERLLDEGEVELVILLYDDLDTLGSRSAEFTNRIDSRVMNALLHALDGLHERGGVLVAGTTNRVDLLDEALIRPGRFGDLILKIGRPDRDAARAVFRCHLRPSVKFWTNGHAATPAEMVEQSIDAAVARLFADSDPKDALAELVLAGGQRRLVWPREVVSGAMIANIVKRAKRRALGRSLIGPVGLVPEDLAAAADDEIDSIAERFADPFKAREILGDRTLPITRGEPRRRRIA
jgi:proteasome-associated ATPase